jgi:hypothetical protein
MDGRKSNEFANLIRERYRDRALGDLLGDAEAIQDMFQHPGWVLLAGLIETAYQRGEEQLITALKPLEQAEYAHKVGFLNGVRTSLDVATTFEQIAREVQQKINDSERQAAAERA